ncbi:MAG: alpha/beta fold hydrolase [Firmicutes bacterium]|nr:alpha/beta fold hydrolase [Bacillota bacterium]
MKINTENLFRDTEYKNGETLPYSEAISITSGKDTLYGYILVPGGNYVESRPCVIMFHGFPGYTNNNDIEQALRRCGCVVIHVNHRGAWGSGGSYTFSGLTEDAHAITDWSVSDETVRKYNIDTENIILIGHSMGGMTVINTLRYDERVKAAAAITPYDLAYWFENGEEELKELIRTEGACLKYESNEAIFENARRNYRNLSLENSYDELKNKNLLLIGAEYDTTAPIEKMILPLWNRLKTSNEKGKRELVIFKTDHTLCSKRVELTKKLGKWMADLI